MDTVFSGSKKTTKKKEREVFDLGYYKQNVHNLSQWWIHALVVLVLGLATVTKYQMFNFPKALTIKDEAQHPGAFIAERAWTDLRILNDFGPRPTGSYANEVLAVDFLKREVSYIQQLAHPNQRIYADVQSVSGAYWANFKPHGMTNVYRNVQNFVVKLVGASETRGGGNHTLMLNCHFDSVAGSPGASDDAASCCVMLETLRVLSKQSHLNKHSIIFLFNGAEETPLQAAHGFITQHPWAPNVRAFLNLESVGSNGKEVLFQSGPNHAWLIDMYQQAAPHPFGQTAAEELFHSGIIPSDTDFRIFRDFGHIPGMDFAHVMNGYRYHTKYDNIDYIPQPVLQRTGDNVLALVKLIANSEELADTQAYASGRKVFYDVLGLFFVSYSVPFGHILNVSVALLSIFVPYFLLNKTTKSIHSKRIRKEMLIGLMVNVLAAVLAFGLCYAIGLELDFTGNSLVWYHHTVFAVVFYCLPTVLVFCWLHRILNDSRNTPLSLGLKVQARLNGSNIMWGALVIYITALGYRSAYLFMVPLAFTLLANIVIGITGVQNSIKKWLYVHIVGQAFVILWTTHCYHLVLAIFIPVAGRSGAVKNPEISLGILCCALTIYISSYLTPLVGLLNKTKWFLLSILGLFVVTRWGCISLTHVGFPYRDHHAGEHPTPQRHMITHTIRTVYDAAGKPTYFDSGFHFRLLDRNAMKTIESLTAPDIAIPDDENTMCGKYPFCGLPFYSCRQLHGDGVWLEGPAPIIKDEAVLKLNSNTKISETLRQLKFTITGNVLLSFQLRLKTGVHLVNWDLTPELPEPNEYRGQVAYFVMMTHGLDAAPKNVTLGFKFDTPNYDGPLLDISLVTFHFEYHKEHTSTFAAMLAKVPSWAFVVPSVASVQIWTF